MKTFDWNQLSEPGKKYRPMVRWWWTGLDVTEEELERELDDMDEAGFAGGEIQAFTRNDAKFDPTNREMAARVHRYATPYYFDLVRRLMEKARERGLILDLTAGSGWPMGDTSITPETGMQGLIVGSVTVEGGKGLQRVELPQADAAMDALLGPEKSSFQNINGRIIQVMDYPSMKSALKLQRVTIGRALGEDGGYLLNPEKPTVIDAASVKDVTGCLVNGLLDYDFGEGTWVVFAAYAGPSYQLVKSDSKQIPAKRSLVVNHFASGLMDQYLERHIGRGRFEEFSPDTFRAFFEDSFELIGPYFWTDAFLTEFRNRKGYELTPYLPFLMTTPGAVDEAGLPVGSYVLSDEMTDRIVYDYESVLADIFCEYFLEQSAEWAHAHGTNARVQCYGHVMDTLRAFGRVDIPETEQLACNGLIDFMKLAGSAAHLYGKPLVTAESLVWPERDYMETPLKFKTGSDRLTICGVGQMIYHGMPYLSERYKYPGFFPWHDAHGTFVARTNPMWPWMKQTNLAIARSQYVVQEGEPVIDVAVYTDNLFYEFSGNLVEELSKGELDGIDRAPEVPGRIRPLRLNRWEVLARKAREVNMALVEAGYDYCHINREMLGTAHLENGVLVAGNARFKALVVAPCDFLSPMNAGVIKALRESGFPVIFAGEVPKRQPGFANHEAGDAYVKNCLYGAEAVTDVTAALKEAGVAGGVCFGGASGLQHVHRRFANADVYFIRSSVFDRRMVTLTFPVSGKRAYVTDPWTGRLAAVGAAEEDGVSKITLPFVSYGTQTVIFTDEEVPADDADFLAVMRAAVEKPACLDLSNGWKLTVESFFGGEPVVLENVSAGDWADNERLADVSGKGTYEKTFTLEASVPEDAVLDLTLVGDIAEVWVNGTKLPDLLSLPYAARVGHLLKEGENTVCVRVTTTLRNGLIGQDKFMKKRQHAMAGMVGPVVVR